MKEHFIAFLLLAVLIESQITYNSLQQQIRNTQKIIYLYSKKLNILKNIHNENFPSRHLQPQIFDFNFNQTHQTRKESQNLLLLKQLNESSSLIGNEYIINNKKIINIDNGSVIADFYGEVLIVEENMVTTLAYNKISLTEIKKDDNGVVTTSQYLVGLNALQLQSMWHRNLNIKDGQDLLIQWQFNVVYLRGKETKMIQLPKQQHIIQIFPFNQYKVIFVSNTRIGIINSRSLQIGQYIRAHNITRLKNKTSIEIISTYKKQNFINILLNTGQIARYYNEKIVNYAIIPQLSTQFSLQSDQIQIQTLNQYIFIISHSLHVMKVYDLRYLQLQTISLPIQTTQKVKYYVYYHKNLYKLMISTSLKTKIYQILIDKPEEDHSNLAFLKVFGFGLIICCFIYFKWVKKSQVDIQNHKNMMAMKKVRMNQNRKIQTTESQSTINRALFQKSGFTQDEIQQFLLLKSRQAGLQQKQKKA